MKSNEKFNRRVLEFLLFGGEISVSCSQIADRCKNFLGEVTNWQEESQMVLCDLQKKRAEVRAVTEKFQNSSILELIRRKRQMEIELQILMIAQELNKIPETVDASIVSPHIVAIRNNFPGDLSPESKITLLLRGRLDFLQRRFLNEFHIFLDEHMSIISSAASSSSMWTEFFDRAKVLLVAYFAISLLPCVIFPQSSEAVAKYKECLDSALTPLWGRFHFHLSQARSDRSSEQLLWTFTYAQSFVQMVLTICSAISSSTDLQKIFPADYDTAGKEQIVYKACKFMRAHLLHIIEEIPVEPENLLIQIIESSLELDEVLSTISPLTEHVSSMIALNPSALFYWITCDFLYAKKIIESACEARIVYTAAFPTWDDTFYCYTSVYECISVFKTFIQRHKYQLASVQGYVSGVFLEPILSMILGLLLLRVRSCAVIRDLSNHRLPFWVGKAAGFDNLPIEIKNFLKCVSYVDDSIADVATSYKCDSTRFLSHWVDLKWWVGNAEWKESSAVGILSQSFRLIPVPVDISSELGHVEGNSEKTKALEEVITVFRAQLKALKNGIEVQIYDALDKESEILLN